VVAIATCISGTAFAQTTTAPSASAEVETVVVLGTRRTDRSVANSAAPVDVISAKELDSQANANIVDAVKNIVPSFFVGQNTIADAGTFVRSPNLRGLPGDQVLVMLNGKRFNRAALVQTFVGGDTALSFGSHGPDISAIPSIAIKNLQILRDGATSQYGSDAIAGVMNFALKDANSGFLVTARYGASMDADDGASTQIAVNGGFALGEKGYINVSAEVFDDEGTSRGARRPAAILFEQQNPTLAGSLPNNGFGVEQVWGSSPTEGWKAVISAGYELSPTAKLYAFANAASSEGDQSFNFRQTNTGTALNANGQVRSLPNSNAAFRNTYFRTPCPTNNATCPAGGFILDNNRFDFRSIYPAGFTPRFVGVNESITGVVGVKGELASGLTYDVSGTLAENSLDLSMYNSLNASFGPASQTRFEYGAFKQKLENVNVDLTYPMEVGLAGPLTLAGGFEWRKETFTVPAGDVQSYSAGPYVLPQRLFTEVSPASSGYAGTPASDAGSFDQSNYAVYVDLEADITDRLSGGIAARFEDYDTFGNATVGKISALYKANDILSFRGSVGTGFQAPSPGQSNLQNVTTNFSGASGAQVQEGIFPVASSVARYYGAQPLKPAKANNYGLGFVVKAAGFPTITVDAYQIDVSNRIFITQGFAVTAADIAAQPSLQLVGAGGLVRYFTNGLDTSTSGIDIVASHTADIFDAKVTFTAAYNQSRNKVERANANVISRAQTATIENLAPKNRLNLSSNWVWEKWAINTRVSYYGEWAVELDYPGQVFNDKTTVDLDLSYNISDNYSITVGAQNLFNVYPDKIAQSASINVHPISGGLADGQVYPRSGGPFGMNGGFAFVSLKASF
jgi:iron complex outermembrane recepter protein